MRIIRPEQTLAPILGARKTPFSSIVGAISVGVLSVAQSLHDPRYRRLVDKLVDERKAAGLTQRDVAARLKKPPSYIAKIESLQRRLDAIELVDVIDAIGLKPSKFIAELLGELKRR